MATVIIPEELQRRLAAIAEAKHTSVESLASDTLRKYLDDEERENREKTEDEARWQRYLRTDESISREQMSRKLQALADEAIAKAG
jgi:predicted transcriptional regulator